MVNTKANKKMTSKEEVALEAIECPVVVKKSGVDIKTTPTTANIEPIILSTFLFVMLSLRYLII